MKRKEQESYEQLNLFDLFQNEEVPILLSEGDVVYEILKGEVTTCTVTDEDSWLCGKKNRGYRLQMQNGCYSIALNSTQNNKWFTDRNSAYKKANSYLQEHAQDIILATEIKPVEIFYMFQRPNGHTAFCVDIGNDLLYMKGMYTYAHIEKNMKTNIKKFLEKESVNSYKTQFPIEFKNMYRCKDASNWEYAEARYSG